MGEKYELTIHRESDGFHLRDSLLNFGHIRAAHRLVVVEHDFKQFKWTYRTSS